MREIEKEVVNYCSILRVLHFTLCFLIGKIKLLSPERVTWLERPFSIEEIQTAVFSLAGDRVPGPEGFTVAFFQECWDFSKKTYSSLSQNFIKMGRVVRQ